MKKLINPFRTSLGYMPCTKELSETKMPMVIYAFYLSFKIFITILKDSFFHPKIINVLAPETEERLKRQTEELHSKIETSTTQREDIQVPQTGLPISAHSFRISISFPNNLDFEIFVIFAILVCSNALQIHLYLSSLSDFG